MRIILHAGANKAGSTAVQEYLHLVRDEMQERGFVYPTLGDKDHWRLAAALMRWVEGAPAGKGHLQRRALRHGIDRDEVKRATAEAIATAPADCTIILSHENFSAPAAVTSITRFLDEVAPGSERLAIAYIRPPHSAYPSVVQQWIKGARPVESPSEWVWSHPARAAAVRRAFGAGATIRAYDRALLADGDVVEDFRQLVRQLVGRELPEAPREVSANTSMSGAACALLYRSADALPNGLAAHSRLRTALEHFSRDRQDPTLQLPAEWRPAIAKRNYAGWNEAVELLAYDPAAKARLRLAPPEGEVESIDRQKLQEWLNAYLDEAYIREFAAYVRAFHEKGISKDVLAWLDQQAGVAVVND